jgi:hypothetical protein
MTQFAQAVSDQSKVKALPLMLTTATTNLRTSWREDVLFVDENILF